MKKLLLSLFCISILAQVSQAQTDAINIVPSGNIGIGTTSAAAFKLQVAGDAGPNADLTFNLGSPSLRWNNLYVNSILGPGALWTRSAPYLYNTTLTDNVGIGVATPGQKLTVIRSAGAGSVADILTGDGTQWTQLNSNSSAGSWNPMVQAGDHSLYYSNGSAETGSLVIGQWSGSSKGIRIASDGNVGIGLASPTATKLQVAGFVSGDDGSGRFSTKWSGDNYHGIWYRATVSADGNTLTTADAITFREYGSSSLGYHFWTGGTTQTERFRITNDYASFLTGNVGIATATTNNRMQFMSDNSAQAMQWNASAYVAANTWGTRIYKSDIGGGIPLKFQTQSAATWYDGIDLDHGQDNAHPSLKSYYNTQLATAGGNVGIGTTGPADKLHIVGNTRVSTLAGTGNRPVYADANGVLTIASGSTAAEGAATIIPIATFGGEPVINSTSWQRVTRTTYTALASMLSAVPVTPGATRKYYLVIRRADNQPGGNGSFWRFACDGGWNGGNDVAGHGFSLASNWGSVSEGTTDWIEIPPTAVSGSGCGTAYWKIDARMQNAGQSMRVMSVSIAAVDIIGGTNVAYSAATGGNATNPPMSYLYENVWSNTPGGSVGIGTSSPVSKLHVSGGVPTGLGGLPANTVGIIENGAASNYLTFRNTVDNGTYQGIQFQDNNVGGYIAFRNYVGSGANDGTNGDYMLYGTYTDHIFQTGSSEAVNGKTEVMRIKQNGNVGIGTAAPNGKLEVTMGNNDGIVIYQPTDDNMAIQGYLNGQWSNRTTYAGGCCNKLLLQPDIGEVGIRTTAPTAVLDVNGATRIRSLTAGMVKSDASGNLSIASGADLPSGSGNYIQNQNAAAQTTSNFWISGEARAKQFNFGHDNQAGSSPAFVDGQFYRRDGQAEMAVDDWFYIRDNDANVRIQFNTDDGSVRSKLFYDIDNTAYYVNPDGQSITRNIQIMQDNVDGQLLFHDPSDVCYSVGIDNSDGRKFKINQGCTLGDYAHFTMQSDGKVGLGTTSPVDVLDVRNAMSVNEIKFRNVGGGDDSDPYRLRKYQVSSNTNELRLDLNDDPQEQFTIYGNSCVGYGCSEYSGNLYHFFRADGTTYHLGNMGIGNTAPASKLHVGGIASGDGILIGNYNDQLGWNGSGGLPYFAIRFAGYRDVVSNFTGAMIAGVRTNLCCSGLSQAMDMSFFVQPNTATVGGDGNLLERFRVDGAGVRSTAYNALSDERLKSNVKTIDYGLKDILQMNPVSYTQAMPKSFRADSALTGEKIESFGFIAQDLYQIVPGLVSKPQDPLNYWAVDYSRLTPILVKAIQEQQKEIEQLKSVNTNSSENTQLKSEIAELKKMVIELEKKVNTK